MKRAIKILGIGLGILLVLAAIGGFILWNYAKNSFLEFEDEYVERSSFPTLDAEGYAYLDRNNNQTLDPYEDDRLPLEQRVEDVLERMTIEEKIHLLKGSGLASALGWIETGTGIPGAVGTIVPTPRLGLPTVYLSDGPAGLRIHPKREGEERTYYATAFPIATQLAASWNVDLVQQVGKAMGTEAREYGLDVMLGPGINLHRHPLTGRNFEYFSEDPLLSGKMGVAMVNGIQSEGVGTSPKHFVANNQETQRNSNDARVGERSMRELYLKNFEIIVREAAPWTIMSAYNKVNGTYASESRELLTDILRDEWNFEGVVMSDWFAGQDAAAMVKAGNDLLEPGTKWQWDRLIEAHAKGQLSEATIDASAKRILQLVFRSHKMKGTVITNTPDLAANATITRQSAAEGIVLLKNEAVLPLMSGQTIALLGTTSFDFIAGGTGSGDVNEAYTISLKEGLRNAGLEIEPTSERLFEDHRAANEAAFTKPEGQEVPLDVYNPPPMVYTDEQIEALAAAADVGIYTLGRNSGEFMDRREKDDFLLTALEKNTIKRASAAFRSADKPFIVVLNVGGVVETSSWSSDVDALLLAWQGGQEGGNATADVIVGQVNPSGKLPMTFPIQVSDHAAHENFPDDPKPNDFLAFVLGTKDRPVEEQVKNEDYTEYDEGIFIGYRHFEREALPVAYPFGFGLSYTDFSLGETSISRNTDSVFIAVQVENIGNVAGKETVQLYTAKPESMVERPPIELRAFAKTHLLEPTENEQMILSVPINDLRYWNEERMQWELEPGVYEFKLGNSSRNILEVFTLEL